MSRYNPSRPSLRFHADLWDRKLNRKHLDLSVFLSPHGVNNTSVQSPSHRFLFQWNTNFFDCKLYSISRV